MLCTVCTDVVVVQTANKNRSNASAGADSKDKELGSILDAGERLVDLECLNHVHSKLRSDKVIAQTANKNRSNASAGLDSRKKGMQQRTSASATLSCS